ncbi:CYTH domain-containing protein [Cocleimonas sp. KMM 6892]|uniref:CYTH domain-containing protein n=1 Tax=unclassified Cocleimonas TaxID=2639732 RepID=UPI002DBDFF22|nr:MULTISPECIES: CYTH domain-containing protein [unclassified Cocleimonas]MEB8434349.1 CYTH domain-containing protein [Cocleimonas sp. KMM 6892]MEC4717248.1 CYTH domain-containing protein [Cocleimonas sp. KMM 6895]MEC4746627.1 CYTH domain-containing protein [Cocleimonas sp. KMM 6896]
MAKEIERKFLIDLELIGDLPDGKLISQGFIGTNDKTVVRARIKGDEAFLTLKGKVTGFTRSEFEYQIPVDDATNIIKELCSGGVVEKTRYEIIHDNHTWEIDIFHGQNEGLVVAEVEVQSESESVSLPKWIVEEVTGDPKYFNVSLLSNPYSQW